MTGLVRSPRRPLLMQLAFGMLWLFVFSIPSEKAYEFASIGTIARVTGLLAMGAAAVAVAAQARFRLPNATHALIAVFMLWSALTYQWTLDPEATWERAVTFAQLFAALLLLWEFCTEEWHALALMDAFVIGSVPVFIKTVTQYLSGIEAYYNRYAMDGFDPNDLALTIALTLPMSYYLSLRRQGWWRGLYWIQILMGCGTILLTGSRGGTLTMVLGLSVVLWTLRALPAKGRWGVIGLGLAGAALAAVLIPPATWQRLMTLGSEVSQGTLNSRTLLWAEGLRAFRDAPVAGVGSGAYPEILEPLMGRPWGFHPVAHNTFLSVLVETGAIGFALFAAVLGSLLVSVARVRDWMFRRYWFTQIAVWGLGVMALTWEDRKPTWIVFGLLIVHSATRMRQVRAEYLEASPAVHPTIRPEMRIATAEPRSPMGQHWGSAV